MQHRHTRVPITVLTAPLTCAVLFAGCGREPERADPNTTSTVATTSVADTEVGDITLSTTGGFAGVEEVVVVGSDGTILRSSEQGSEPEPTGGTVPAEELAVLHGLVGSEEFATLEDTYIPEELCCDQFRYELTAQVGDTSLISATADGVDAPQVLQEVVSKLRALD